jgi:SNF2 family DNA or RNA helicase
VISIFKRKKNLNFKMIHNVFQSEERWLIRFHLLNNENMVSTQVWDTVEHSGANWLTNFDKNEDVELDEFFHVNENDVVISAKNLIEEIKKKGALRDVLELPNWFDGGIHFESHGVLTNNNYQINYNWLNSKGRFLNSAIRKGAFIEVGGVNFLLNYHAWHVVEKLDEIKNKIGSLSYEERIKILEELKSSKNMLPPEAQDMISESPELLNIKLFFANSFRIEAIPEGDSYSIRPVLLKKCEFSQDIDNYAYEEILSPNEHNRFVELFQSGSEVKFYYNLGVSKYLIINDDVLKALALVQHIQHASTAEKLEFLKNPKAFFMENLEGILEEEVLNQIFSERVIGIGDWGLKVIPWIKLPSTDWLPESDLSSYLHGIDIGGKKIQFHSIDETRELVEKFDYAIKHDLPIIEYRGHEIHVSHENRNRVEALLPTKPDNLSTKTDATQNLNVEDNKSPCPVMLVKENFETVEFKVRRIPRQRKPSQFNIPHCVKTTPKEHQLEAFNWLCEHYYAGSRGVLLADDMGLGKTFQSLMFLAWIREAMEHQELLAKPLLIVAPTGLLKNWEKEIEIHTPDGLANLVQVYGTNLKRLKNGRALDIKSLQNAGVVLTTYDTLTRYQTSFSVVNFAVVVFDEIQKLKNPSIQNYSAASSLNAGFWLGMTGTPVENRLCDLWAIIDVLQPGMLGSIKEFSLRYEKVFLENNPELILSAVERLKNGLCNPCDNAPAFMLRRMKGDILKDLPIKTVKIYEPFMPKQQADAYTQIIKRAENKGSESGVMLSALMDIKLYSLHYLSEKVNNMSDEDFINSSARLKECFQILDKIHKNKEKALIFVEYLNWMGADFLRLMIKKRYNLEKLPLVINGKIKSEIRQAYVDEFQEKTGVFDVMLISPKAGGVGLTLTAANHVIHLTRWWNPAVEDQANDRVYRIGQKKPVYIHYILSIHPDFKDDSFDKSLHKLLEGKRNLSNKVLLPIPNNDSDSFSNLIKNTFKHGKEVSLNDTYSFDETGLDFENLVFNKLNENASSFGYLVRKTQKSYDGGADMIIQSIDGAEIKAIIQCKQVSNNEKIPQRLTDDLNRAELSYGCSRAPKSILKVGITNAIKLSNKDSDWSKNSEYNLILKGDECLNPHITIFNKLMEVM